MAQLLMKKLKEQLYYIPEISIDLDDQLHNFLDIVENSELEWIAKYIECRRFIHDRAN